MRSPALFCCLGVFCALPAVASLTAAEGGSPCITPDRGDGTANLPFEGCRWAGPLSIIDGLPPGTTIEISAFLQNYLCLEKNCETPGGNLGGFRHDFDADWLLQMTGTGDLAGFQRQINLPVFVRVDSAPRTPGDPVQFFETDLFQAQGALFGDPDFDFLQIAAGANFGLPSPGQTTLTDLGDGNFQVDSFFDVSYQIDFVGAPGGTLDGLSGSTQSFAPHIAEGTLIFEDGFESGDLSAWTNSVP